MSLFTVQLFDSHFSPFEAIAKHQILSPAVGAQSIFVGYMRDFREDNTVERMVITHYSPMTEKQLEKLATNAVAKYQLLDLYIAHRVGTVAPTDTLVVISATASHRTNAITAVSQLLEDLKHTAPFWKKEITHGQSQWVESNTDNSLR